MAAVNLTILGLERLGTSFGLALKRYMGQKDARHTFTITGFDERGYNGKKARQLGAVDSVARSEQEAVAKAQVVVLAAPYYQVKSLYEIVGPALQPGAVVLDTSPLKAPSLGWAKANLPQQPEVAAYMVGITPVLNPEVLMEPDLEVDGSRADLFDKGTVIVAPAADCPAEAVQLAVEMARLLGAGVHFMDVAEHDGLIAAMEGLPAVLGAILFQTLSQAEAWDDLRRLANPSFGLATHHLRFQHPDSLWSQLHYNRENVARYLDAFIGKLEAVRDSLREDSEGLGLEALLVEGATKYEEWEGQRLANRWEQTEEAPAPEGFINTMGGLLLGRRPARKDDEDTRRGE